MASSIRLKTCGKCDQSCETLWITISEPVHYQRVKCWGATAVVSTTSIIDSESRDDWPHRWGLPHPKVTTNWSHRRLSRHHQHWNMKHDKPRRIWRETWYSSYRWRSWVENASENDMRQHAHKLTSKCVQMIWTAQLCTFWRRALCFNSRGLKPCCPKITPRTCASAPYPHLNLIR